MRQLKSLSFVLFLSFVLSLFKILLLCTIILLLKLLVQLYDTLIVLRLNILLYGWFSSKDVVIKFKNYFPILEFTFRLNVGLKNIISLFLLYRLLNPSKSPFTKYSKNLTDKTNLRIRKNSKLNKWKDTDENSFFFVFLL